MSEAIALAAPARPNLNTKPHMGGAIIFIILLGVGAGFAMISVQATERAQAVFAAHAAGAPTPRKSARTARCPKSPPRPNWRQPSQSVAGTLYCGPASWPHCHCELRECEAKQSPACNETASSLRSPPLALQSQSASLELAMIAASFGTCGARRGVSQCCSRSRYR